MAVPAGDDDAQFESDVAGFAKFLVDNNNRLPRRFSKAELDASEDKEAANNEHNLGCLRRRMRELQKSISGEATEKLKQFSAIPGLRCSQSNAEVWQRNYDKLKQWLVQPRQSFRYPSRKSKEVDRAAREEEESLSRWVNNQRKCHRKGGMPAGRGGMPPGRGGMPPGSGGMPPPRTAPKTPGTLSRDASGPRTPATVAGTPTGTGPGTPGGAAAAPLPGMVIPGGLTMLWLHRSHHRARPEFIAR